MANGMAANIPGSARPLKLSAPAQPLVVKWLQEKPGATTPMNTSSFEDGQQSDDQLEGGGDADAENIERHKRSRHGAAGDPFRIQRRKLHVEVGPDGHGDGRRGEDEFNQGGKTSDKAAGGPEGAVGVGERGRQRAGWRWSAR